MRARIAFLLALFLIPLASAATSHSGWYYAGDTFEYDGILYSVEGTDHERVLLSIGSRSIFLTLDGECHKEGFIEYCYDDTGYPDDDDHIEYVAGDVFYAYHITITSDAPTVKLTREFTTKEPLIEEEVVVTVTLENTGGYNVRDITYVEPLPDGLLLNGMPAKEFRYEIPSLTSDKTTSFKYRLKPKIYDDFVLFPNATFTYQDALYNITTSKVTLEVESPIDVERGVSSSLQLEEVGTYSLNLTNDDEEDREVTLSIRLPPGVEASKLKGLTVAGRTLTAKTQLRKGEDAEYSFAFTADRTAEFFLSIDAGDNVLLEYKDTTTTKDDRITPTLSLSTVRTTYSSGMPLTLTGKIENKNDAITFRRIQGTISGPFSPVTASQESIAPEDSKTLTQTVWTTPDVANATEYTLSFNGTYETTSGVSYTFGTTKKVKVVPLTQYLEITRTVEPSKPVAGQNVTVTVEAKNMYGVYLTFDANERLPEGTAKNSGITYAEVSLERDEKKQLYVYTFQLPEGDTPLNLTTLIRVEDNPVPEEHTTTIYPEGVATPEEIAAAEAAAEAERARNQAEATVTEEKPGVFKRVWTWLKGFFD